MAKTFTSENLQTVFTYPFQDAKWLEKFFVGSLLFLLGFTLLPMFLIYGYFAEIVRNSIAGKELLLPDWDEWEKKFTDGAKLFIVGLIYSLPMILLFMIIFLFPFVGAIGAEFFASMGDADELLWTITSLIGTFGWMVMFGLTLIISLLMGLITPAVVCHVIAEDDFSAAFQFSDWWKIFRANLAGFAITYLLVMGLLTLLNFFYQILAMTIVLCCLAPFILIPGTFYIMVASSALFGQAYREGVQSLQE
jgi:hypothetical protein